MNDFVAIDVETANGEPSSICAIGAVKVTDGVISDRFYELVKPEPEYYFRHFTLNIHGIDRKDTENARVFSDVWRDVHRLIGGLPLVAYSLPFVCEFLGIPFYNHHDALADAEGCAKIAMTIL